MSNNNACCACLTVQYEPVEVGHGRVTSRWICKDCKRRFAPVAAPEIPTLAYRKMTEGELESAKADIARRKREAAPEITEAMVELAREEYSRYRSNMYSRHDSMRAALAAARGGE